MQFGFCGINNDVDIKFGLFSSIFFSIKFVVTIWLVDSFIIFSFIDIVLSSILSTIVVNWFKGIVVGGIIIVVSGVITVVGGIITVVGGNITIVGGIITVVGGIIIVVGSLSLKSWQIKFSSS